jgi:hypothetical protein
MAWTTPKTDWATDTVISDTLLNNIGNNLVDLDGRIGDFDRAYGDYSFSMNSSDVNPTTVTAHALIMTPVALAGIAPKRITLFLKKFTGTQSTGLLRSAAGALPTGLRPDTDISIPCTVIDASSHVAGFVFITAAGTLQFFRYDIAGFSGGLSGFPNLALSYPIWP